MPPHPVARVREHCRRNALLPPGGAVLAMVSGGADSTCLVGILSEIHDGPVIVLTLDHGLRAESAGEVERVRQTARSLGLRCIVRRLDVAPGAGLQNRARDARRAAADEVAAAEGCAVVATGHTASDQAETVLFRLARGAGRSGAIGMTPRRGRLVRPLLCLDRDETRAWCRARGLSVVDDPSNADRRFARARVRHDLLPALARVHGGAERSVAAFADRLRDEGELLDGLLDAAWERCAAGPGLDADRLAVEPAPLARLLIRRLLARAGLPGEAGSASAVERVRDAAGRGRGADLPGGGTAVERGVLVAFAGPRAATAPPPVELVVPGAARFGDSVLRARPGVARKPGPDRVAVDVCGPLVVRAPRPGDRIAVAGVGRQSLGKLLAERGVPARSRPGVPVVAQGDRVVWVAGHRAAADLLAAPGRPAVELEVRAA